MIEITCTSSEKTRIIDALVHSSVPCLFPRKAHWCVFEKLDCRECVEKKIKWNVRPRAGSPAAGRNRP